MHAVRSLSVNPAWDALCPVMAKALRVPTAMVAIDLGRMQPLLHQRKTGTDPLRRCLSIEEQQYFSRFHSEKRIKEWLGGRLAAKMSLCQLQGVQPATTAILAQWTVLPDINGRPVPFCRNSSMPLPALSISHSEDFAVALATRAADCGIDLQKISSKLPRLMQRFTTPEELDLFQQQRPEENDDAHLTMIWTAKEAFKKAQLYDSHVSFQGISIRSVEWSFEEKLLAAECHCQQPVKRSMVFISGIQGYNIACCLGGRHA
ncbi:MAG: hypothetical protein CSA34_05970 [Desulfobulbus propionicus]|nr:MAG: hypothetical protein CSA34_05970 [Desulfobulbus propionicus]